MSWAATVRGAATSTGARCLSNFGSATYRRPSNRRRSVTGRRFGSWPMNIRSGPAGSGLDHQPWLAVPRPPPLAACPRLLARPDRDRVQRAATEGAHPPMTLTAPTTYVSASGPSSRTAIVERHRSGGSTLPKSSWPKSAITRGWRSPAKTRGEFMIRCP